MGFTLPEEPTYTRRDGRIAQLGEHSPYKAGVAGSSPAPPTNLCRAARRVHLGPRVDLHHRPAALAVDGNALAALTVATLFARRRGVAAAPGRASLTRAAVDAHLAVGLTGQGLADGVIELGPLTGDDEDQLALGALRSRRK